MTDEDEVIVGMKMISGFSWKVGRAVRSVGDATQRAVVLSVWGGDAPDVNVPFSPESARHLAARLIEEADKSDASAAELGPLNPFSAE